MRNVILKVGLSVGYKTVLIVKSLQVGLCADPDGAFAQLVTVSYTHLRAHET